MKNNELTAVKGEIPSLDGLPQPVIEYVMGLVAENVVLRECCKACDADGLAEYGEQWEVTPLEIPNTDAAIAEIKAQGVDEYAAITIAIGEEEKEPGIIYAGKQAQLFAANLRAGRKG